MNTSKPNTRAMPHWALPEGVEEMVALAGLAIEWQDGMRLWCIAWPDTMTGHLDTSRWRYRLIMPGADFEIFQRNIAVLLDERHGHSLRRRLLAKVDV